MSLEVDHQAREVRRALEIALQASHAGMWALDVQTNLVRGDATLAGFFSVPVEACVQGTLPLSEYLRALHPEDKERVDRAIAAVLDTQDDYELDYRVSRADGGLLWLSARGRILRDNAGRATHFHGLVLDITSRKRSEALLRQSEERYRTLFATMDEGFCVMEMIFDADSQPVDYRFIELNPAFERLTGISADRAATGATARELVPQLEERWVQAYGQVALTGQPARFVSGSDAMGRWFDVYAFPTGAHGSAQVGLLFNNITERKRVEQEREQLLIREQQARAQAEEAGRLKDEFLATLSHELRTPLTAVLGWSRMLRGGQLDREATQRALEVIERNASAQVQMIDDLLDVSRIITGKLRLNVQGLEPADVVGWAVDALRPAAEAKEISLQALLDPHAGPVSGDPDRLQQIVWNLVSNAIKFTPKGGRVQVRLERVNSHVEIVVSDTGSGIDAQFVGHAFDRFRQAQQSTTRRHGGLGLGLAIVRQLVELHGGTVTAHSDGPGQGATFTVCLPLLPLRAVSADQHPAGHGTTPHGALPPLGELRVLVVDDEPDARDWLRSLLTASGATVSVAGSAEDALHQLEQARFDVLVCDIGMPGQDGYALLESVRKLPPEHNGGVPAAALTAFTRVQDRVKALRSGFQMHVPKPVDPVELITVLASLAGRQVAD